jgi:hypothetical protein
MGLIHIRHIRDALKKRFDRLIDLSDLGPNVPPDQREDHFLTRSLSAFVIAELARVDDKIAANAVVDGSDDNGIDAFYYDSTERVCYLIQSKWVKDGKSTVELGGIHKFVQGVLDFVQDKLDIFGKLKKKKTEIESALSDSAVRFVLVVAYTGEPALADKARRPLDDLLIEQNDVSELFSFRPLGQAALYGIIAGQALGESVDLEVMLHEWGYITDPFLSYYGQVDLADIVTWKKFGTSLYHRNLRGFKGNTDVNEGIVNTAKSAPEKFWYFNNGITILCNELKKQPLGGADRESGVFDCEGASVVNGAQTVGSIISAADGGDNDGFKHARVLVRLISLKNCPPGFADQLTRAANTQNRIEKKDFAALDPEQQRLKTELFLECHKEYSYRAGDREPSPDEGCTLDEATVALACAQSDVDLCVTAKREMGRLYDDITQAPYKVLFNPQLSALKLWRCVDVLRAVDNALKVLQTKLPAGRERLIAIHGNRFILYRVFRGIAGLEDTDAEFGRTKAQIPEATKSVLDEVTVVAQRLFPNAYPSNLFKNAAKCKELVAEIDHTADPK